MPTDSKAKKNISPLPDDWLHLSQTSGLFRLVASRTSPRGHDDKKLGRVTIHQARIFGHIFSNPDIDIRIKRLAHDLDITPAAASQAVDRLVSEGLLDRHPDPTDRRAVVITISEKGRQFLEKIKAESNALLADIYREIDLTPEEAATFGNVLSRIHEALVRRWCDYIDGGYIPGSAGILPAKSGGVEEWGNGGIIPGDAGILPAGSTTPQAGSPGSVGILPAESPTSRIGWHCRHYLPHCEDKRLQTITFRLFDSLPAAAIEEMRQELRALQDLPDGAEKNARMVNLRKTVDRYEDSGYGSCFLRDPRIAQIVVDALRHFDGERYVLVAYCIMPNHVHVIVDLAEGWSLSDIMHSWRSFSANKANRILNRTGQFWMEEYFDRYIRDEKHFANALEYLLMNPVKAGLATEVGQWPWTWEAPGSASGSAGIPGSAGILPAKNGEMLGCMNGGVAPGSAGILPARTYVPRAGSPRSQAPSPL